MSIAEKLTTLAENVPKVYEAGQQAEYDKFWDVFQENGKRTDYYVGFYGAYWNNDNFKPKYPLKPTSLNNTFSNSKISGDFTELCELDTSNCTILSSAFTGMTYLTKLGVLNCRKIEAASVSIASCPSLHTVEKIIFPDTGTKRIANFNGCTSLANIVIEGKMGGGSISFSVSPLTVESMNSIINSLYDYSGTGKTYTLSFKADRESLLPQEYKDIATNKGWTLVWN